MNKKGELLWALTPMPRWQMEMFRVRYLGDFMAHWMMRQLREITGWEAPDDFSSMELKERGKAQRLRYKHPGD